MTKVETTRTIVERTIQYLRRYLDGDESEIAPGGKSGYFTIIFSDEDRPMTGCATKPLIGPASHTRLVSCSEIPSESKNGVP